MAGFRQTIELSVQIYERLIRAYPASFRREYAEEMALVFREYMTDKLHRGGVRGIVLAWFRVLGDLARTVPAEHFHEMQRETQMKSTAMALSSLVFAAIVHFLLWYVTILVVWLPVALIVPDAVSKVAMYVLILLSAFLAGLLLTRVKPFFMPAATVPLGIMGAWLIFGTAVLRSEGPSWLAPTWGMVVVRVVFTVSLGLAALWGSIVATRVSRLLSRFSIPWYQWTGSLAVLVCTSIVVFVLRLTLTAYQLAGGSTESSLDRVWPFCIFAMLVTYIVAIGNVVFLVIRNQRNAAVR